MCADLWVTFKSGSGIDLFVLKISNGEIVFFNMSLVAYVLARPGQQHATILKRCGGPFEGKVHERILCSKFGVVVTSAKTKSRFAHVMFLKRS